VPSSSKAHSSENNFRDRTWHCFGASRSVFLNRRAAARYRALALIVPGCERFSWKLWF